MSGANISRRARNFRVEVSFSYVEAGPLPVNNSMKKRDKKGPVSIPQRMLAERELQLNAEEESSGQPSIWREVYSLMRCPGPPSNLGSYCWITPEGKKHYKLKTHHFRDLIKHVERAGLCRLTMTSPMISGNSCAMRRSRDGIGSREKQRCLLPAYLQSISTCCLDLLIKHPYQLHRFEPKLRRSHHMRPQMCL